MGTITKSEMILAWAGFVLLTYKEKEPYIVLVKDKNGILGLPGGRVEHAEQMINAGVREVREEVNERIWARTAKELWVGDTIYRNAPSVVFALYLHLVPFFESRTIANDDDIVEARTYSLPYVLNHMLDRDNKFKRKDKLLLQKVRDQLVLFLLPILHY